MNTVLKYPGSKWSTANWIISNFPHGYEKMTYLEPYLGSGAVFFNKNRSKIETINDLDGSVVNLFKVIREHPEELAKLIKFTPWSRQEYRESYEINGDSIEDARCFLVRCWQAIGTKTSDITGWANCIKPADNGKSRWCRLEPSIQQTALRLKSEKLNIVQIENTSAIDLIKTYNRPYVFIYCDPPYVLSTRSKRIYRYEMTDDEHVELLTVLKEHSGPVIISGYMNDIYKELLKGWVIKTNKSNCEKGKTATEVIWMNYEAGQLRMEV
ncbi:DNA adenine methylase [Sedimentibacter acidaminivorans]|uniref:site-specific DNA-methyltransferase (adenine-specific) n=1 Tax=Sedimentibacter acidaminivorans TaxID=913099 RepID=A0ABS4GA90_9FIRM|nr:DNA adenine methylase [Sedimentibacter acidaminivorans]